MRAITIRQPWAWAILTGRKRVENRTWQTRFRGRILVHAATRWADDHVSWAPRDLPLGAIVGSIEIYDCVPLADVRGDPWARGPWCWLLRTPEPFSRAVPYRGRLGLFEVAPEEAPALAPLLRH